MNRYSLILILVLATLLVSGVEATVITAEGVTSYSMTADSGQVIYQIYIDPVPMGLNQSHVLNYNGAVFLLTIGTYQDYGVYNNFDLSLTYPNGTVETKHLTLTGPFAGQYTVEIQPVFWLAQSTNYAVHVTIGVSPLYGGLNEQSDILGGNQFYNTKTAIPFTAVSGDLGDVTNVFVYEIPYQDFLDNVTNFNAWYGANQAAGIIFSWTWDLILGFISAIPVIGPLFLSTMSMLGLIAGEILFWVTWTVVRLPAVILSLEVVIIMAAFIREKKKDPDLGNVAGNIWKYNVMCIKGFIWIFDKLFHWLAAFIRLVALAIQALKP